MKDFDKDRSQVIERAMKAGITHIITIGTDLTSSVKALQLANGYDFIFSSIGYHPHNAENIDPSTLKELSGMAAESKIANLRKTDFHEIARRTSENTKKLFRLPDLP